MSLPRQTFATRAGTIAGTATKLVLVAALAGWGLLRGPLAPVPVTTHLVERGDVDVEVMGTGTLDARFRAVVSTRIPGRLSRVEVDQGERVTAGQVVALLDDVELRRQVEVEEAGLELVKASLQRLQAERSRAVAIQAKATADQRRNRELLARKAISEAENDRSLESVGVAAAELARADAVLEEGRRQVAAAQSKLEVQRERLADATLRAPFDGLIVRRDRDPGDVVVPGTSVLLIVSTVQMWCRAWVNETAQASLRVGQPARVSFRSEPGRSYDGKVVRLGREADRESRELLVDVEVTRLPVNWAVGQRAEVYIRTARRERVVRLPSRLLVRRPGEPEGTYVVSEGRARWRQLTVGVEGRDTLEIVRGLEAGEVVAAPRETVGVLSDGRRVALP
jgi:RND family efflux transporter MFP subunit